MERVKVWMTVTVQYKFCCEFLMKFRYLFWVMCELWYDSWCGRHKQKMMEINIFFIADVNILETDSECHYT